MTGITNITAKGKRADSCTASFFIVPHRQLSHSNTVFHFVQGSQIEKSTTNHAHQYKNPHNQRHVDKVLRDFHQKIDLQDRKSTRLNSSHVKISYAVFCLK